jgi:hypothetical protein
MWWALRHPGCSGLRALRARWAARWAARWIRSTAVLCGASRLLQLVHCERRAPNRACVEQPWVCHRGHGRGALIGRRRRAHRRRAGSGRRRRRRRSRRSGLIGMMGLSQGLVAHKGPGAAVAARPARRPLLDAASPLAVTTAHAARPCAPPAQTRPRFCPLPRRASQWLAVARSGTTRF